MLARAHDMRYQAEVRWMNIWWMLARAHDMRYQVEVRWMNIWWMLARAHDMRYQVEVRWMNIWWMLARAHDMRYQAEVRWMNIWWIHNDVDVSGHDRYISETGINFKKIKVLFLFSAKQGVRAISEWVMIMSTCGLVLVNESESW
jgi:hypothetical protein